MRHFLDRLYLISGGLAALFIVAISLLVFLQVLLNMIDRVAKVLTGSTIGLTIPSYSDFTGFFLAAATFFALAYTLRMGEHIRINLISSRLPQGMQQILEIFSLLIALSLSVYMTSYLAMLFYESWQYHDMSSGIIAVPLWIPQLSLVLGSLILAIAVLDELINVLKGRAPSYQKLENSVEHHSE